MAATTSFAATRNPVVYGRSGYNNKPDEDDEQKPMVNFGRSGYNKGGDDDEEDS
ncbi:hypothetical protein MAPG_08914 [Magnaporthiopsis poae ATCC 64411]|uniref:Uncharacterized protein n=1 Tax=Magnaporthiopsis poae (strain ATCC 64411 / 73-15) TaxID=644358 RepID=A0A0C4E8K5_MAGP6|nr:hypothetical protein MAPG_08914 [Magnaporthiopsis poae ATCC 64411]